LFLSGILGLNPMFSRHSFLASASIVSFLALSPASSARAGDYPFAKANFESLSLSTRYDREMLLGVAGYWPAVATDNYDHRLFAAITQFQSENGLSPTAYIGDRDLVRLHALADPLLNRWGMRQIRHPATNEILWIPAALLPIEQRINTGVTFRNFEDTVSVAFTHHDHRDLGRIYNNLMAVPRDHLIYEKLSPEFFVIMTTRGESNAYSRYHNTSDGITGFTLRWRSDDANHGERIATLMSDLFRAEFSLGQDRYPPMAYATPAVSNVPAAPYEPSQPAASSSLAFAGSHEATPDPVALAQEQARVQQTQQQEQARIQQVKQAQTEKLTPAAKQLIDDASALIKANPSHPKLLDFVEMIGALNKAIEDKDADSIDKRSMALSGALHKEPAFVAIENQRLDEQKRANAKFLGDALALGQRQKGFMLSYVAQEPTSAAAAAFLPLIRQMDPILSKANLPDVQSLTEKVDLVIRQASLSGAFTAWSPAIASTPLTSLQVSSTDKNRFLIDGDLGDIVLAMNAAFGAPHIAKNLRGDIVFQNDEVNVCFDQRDVGDELIMTVKIAVQKLGASVIHIFRTCDTARLEQYDVVAANRGAFLKMDPATALAVVKQIEADAFKPLLTLSAVDLKREADDRAKTAAMIAAEVAAAAREGYGVIVLKNGSSTLCTVYPDKADGHRATLVSYGDRLAIDMATEPVLSATSPEQAFVLAQRGQCGALYGAAKDLKSLDAALTRENIDHRFAPLWIKQADIDLADQKAVEARAKSAQDAADLQREAEDERKLATQRAADSASTNAAKQAVLRGQYGRTAQSAAATVASELKGFSDTRAGVAASKYPAFANWLTGKLADHWEVMSFNSELADYGVASWKDRPLDTAFARITIKLKNRMLGEYQDACFIVGQIVDSEFSTVREPVIMPCEKPAGIARWKTAHRFESRWIIE
jgi:hypothetical protein